jgi:hypothetical protein
MRSLPEWQAGFARRLLHGDGSPGMSAYRRNAFGNWGAALAGAFPVVRKIVGAGFFDGLARTYALAAPSASGDLNRYGDALPEFLEAFEPVRDLPYLPDVARMEWRAHRAYYAADAEALDPRAPLTGQSVLRLAPSCALLESPWPLGRLWEVHQDDYTGTLEVDLAAGTDRVLVHRPRWHAAVATLAPGDFRFLAAIAAGETLGAALESACAEAAFDPSTALARWAAAGVLANPETTR